MIVNVMLWQQRVLGQNNDFDEISFYLRQNSVKIFDRKNHRPASTIFLYLSRELVESWKPRR